jgi:hypothetical protein
MLSIILNQRLEILKQKMIIEDLRG